MRSIIVAGLLCGVALLPGTAAADDREAVSRLLEKMASAGQSLNYTGAFTFVNGDKSWTMRIVHSFDKHGEREYLSTIAGELREVYRDDHSLVSVIPDKEMLLIEEAGKRSAAGAFDRQFTTTSDFYDYYLDGTEEIAGYTCQVVSIVPRDSYRFGYRLCLEAESGLLLKSQVVDKAGQPKEQLIFNRLELPEKSPDIRFSAAEYDWIADAGEPAVEPEPPNTLDLLPRWKLGWTPPGFEITQDRTRIVPGSRTPVRHIVLDDGVATISVFIKQPGRGERYHASRESSGALNTLMNIKQGFVVAVIGEVPEPTISAIYAGLEPAL